MVEFFCPRWGSEHIPWNEFIQLVAEAGYKGIEWFPTESDEDIEKVVELLGKYDLKFAIVMTVPDRLPDFSSYLKLLEKRINSFCAIGVSIGGPLFISAQTGREYNTQDEILSILEICKKCNKNSIIPIYQETHRNKWTFAAHVIPPILDKEPETLFTLDISHWFCVSESYLEDQSATIKMVLKNTRHIHARVGYTQASQVIDPWLPEYKQALNAHLQVWDKWVQNSKKEKLDIITITPEFGPPPYLINTNPINSDWQQQWDLNLRMKDFLDCRYN